VNFEKNIKKCLYTGCGISNERSEGSAVFIFVDISQSCLVVCKGRRVQFVMQRYTPKERAESRTKLLAKYCNERRSTLFNGGVNKQNSRYWGTENPLIIHEHVQFDQKVTVWCGICSEKIIEPYFFEDNDGKAISINGGHYRAEQFFGTTSAQTWCGRPVFPTG